MKIILLSAKARHGKDYTASLMKEVLETKNQRVCISHYADLLKFICTNYFNWDGEKDDIGRSILQKVGTDRIRKINPDYWVGFVSEILSMFEDKFDYVLIPDTRFPNEIEYMKERFDTVSVRIVRDNFVSSLTDEQKRHASEIALDDYKFDYVIHNDGTKYGLMKVVKEFLGVDYE